MLKNTIITILLGITGVTAVSAYYQYEEIHSFRLFEVYGVEIIRFVDPDNGNVCYLGRDGYNVNLGGISCVK